MPVLPEDEKIDEEPIYSNQKRTRSLFHQKLTFRLKKLFVVVVITNTVEYF